MHCPHCGKEIENMKTRHTPGPWVTNIGGGGCNVVVNSTVLPPILVPIPANYLLEHPERVREAQANARLIAAAPALAEALEAMISAMWQHFEYHHDGDDDCGSENCQRALDQARAAIAAATGEAV